MAVTLREREYEPAKAIGEAPLDTPDDQKIADLWAGIDNARDIRATWARIEAWVSVRWTPRAVVWTVEGDGEWEPPLSPATFATVEIWRGAAWEAAPLAIGPMGGLWLDEWGTYRVTATVGAGPLPAAVTEAFWRLMLYCAERDGRPGAATHETAIGDLRETVTRAPTWLARAMTYSGAADLLRQYRRTR